jgi:hypothetical protein
MTVFTCLHRGEKLFLSLAVHDIIYIYILQKTAGLGVDITDKQGNTL